MRDELRERLATEMTRKQFLQFLMGALLMVFGFNNLIALLSGPRVVEKQLFLSDGDRSSFGTRKFGV